MNDNIRMLLMTLFVILLCEIIVYGEIGFSLLLGIPIIQGSVFIICFWNREEKEDES